MIKFEIKANGTKTMRLFSRRSPKIFFCDISLTCAPQKQEALILFSQSLRLYKREFHEIAV